MALLVHGNFIETSNDSGKLVLDRIEITKPASKTSFLRNDTFTIDGLEVTAIYIENEVDIYDLDLVRTSPEAPLTSARYNLAGASIGEYALFAGGYVNIATVDVYGVT